MQRVMQNNAAVFRTQETLEEGGLLVFPVSSFQFGVVGTGLREGLRHIIHAVNASSLMWIGGQSVDAR